MPAKNITRHLAPVLFAIASCAPASALCIPGADIKPESGYSYLREEVKVLQAMNRAIEHSEKLNDPPLLKDDPQRIHKEVEFYSALHDVEDDYSCAESLLRPFSASKNPSIQESSSSILFGMELIKKAANVEELNQLEIGKRLADLKSLQKDARTLVMLGVRASAFSVLKYEGQGEDSKPIAFTINQNQHARVMSDLKEILPRKGKSETYIDLCITSLNKILSTQLPFAN